MTVKDTLLSSVQNTEKNTDTKVAEQGRENCLSLMSLKTKKDLKKDAAEIHTAAKVQASRKQPEQYTDTAAGSDSTRRYNLNDEVMYEEPFRDFENSDNAEYITLKSAPDHEADEREMQLISKTVHPHGEKGSYFNSPVDEKRTLSRKELFEQRKHGSGVFPFACYVWVPQNKSYRVPLHWHSEPELVRFKKGEFKVNIDMHSDTIEEECFVLIPGNIMHTFIMPAHCEESAVLFDPHMLALQGYDEVQSEIFEALSSGYIPMPPAITKSHPAYQDINRLYEYCIQHGQTDKASERLRIKAKLLEIISIYHEHGLLSRKEIRQDGRKSKQGRLKELLNYIDSHYAGPMSTGDASKRLGVTDQYFCRFFKKLTGMSFTEYLNDLRLRRAAREIELTDRPIAEVAFDHGFENTGYFFKSFKNKFGTTPLKYRKQKQSENTALLSEQ